MKFLKHLSLCLFASSLLVTSCSKKDDGNNVDKTKSTAEVKKSLEGMWIAKSDSWKEYDESGNVIDQGVETYADNELIVSFSEGGSYGVTWDDGTSVSGTYEVKEQTTKHNITGYYLSLKEGSSTQETEYMLITVSGNTLNTTSLDEDLDSNNKPYLSEMSTITFTKK